MEGTSGSCGSTPSFTMEDQKGNCPGSLSLGQTAPGLLLPNPRALFLLHRIFLAKMLDGRELSDYLLLPPHSTGGEIEAQTCIGWCLPFQRCSTAGLLQEDGEVHNDNARVGKWAGELPSLLGHKPAQTLSYDLQT